MFWLALQIGCTVKELGKKLDSRELSEWRCYFSVLNEKEERQREEVKKQQEEEKKKATQAKITHGVITAGAFKKVKKRKE